MRGEPCSNLAWVACPMNDLTGLVEKQKGKPYFGAVLCCSMFLLLRYKAFTNYFNALCWTVLYFPAFWSPSLVISPNVRERHVLLLSDISCRQSDLENLLVLASFKPQQTWQRGPCLWSHHHKTVHLSMLN